MGYTAWDASETQTHRDRQKPVSLTLERCLTSAGITTTKIRQSWHRIIIIIGIPIPGKTVFILKQGPGCLPPRPLPQSRLLVAAWRPAALWLPVWCNVPNWWYMGYITFFICTTMWKKWWASPIGEPAAVPTKNAGRTSRSLNSLVLWLPRS